MLAETKTAQAKPPTLLFQILFFLREEALSCLFPVSIFLILGITQKVHIPGIARYDLILLLCLAVQAAMYFGRLETLDEIKVICLFHLFGLGLELFKTHTGSWSYPEHGLTKFFGVPLYSGFMYASVASYMCQAWRRLNVHLYHWPTASRTMPLAVAIYGLFFADHIVPDLRIRLVVIGLVFIVFWRNKIEMNVAGAKWRWPMVIGFLLVGFSIWIAENIATFLGGWQYPNQIHAWNVVHYNKITSWFLLVIISFIGVAELKHVKANRDETPDPLTAGE